MTEQGFYFRPDLWLVKVISRYGCVHSPNGVRFGGGDST